MRRQRELATANQACQHISHGAREIHLRSFLAVIQEDEDPDSGILKRPPFHIVDFGIYFRNRAAGWIRGRTTE